MNTSGLGVGVGTKVTGPLEWSARFPTIPFYYSFYYPLPLPNSPEGTNGPRCQQERKRGRPAGSDTLQMAPYYPGVTITVLLQCSVEEVTCEEGHKRMDTSQLQNKERWYDESPAFGSCSNKLVALLKRIQQNTCIVNAKVLQNWVCNFLYN